MQMAEWSSISVGFFFSFFCFLWSSVPTRSYWRTIVSMLFSSVPLNSKNEKFSRQVPCLVRRYESSVWNLEFANSRLESSHFMQDCQTVGLSLDFACQDLTLMDLTLTEWNCYCVVALFNVKLVVDNAWKIKKKINLVFPCCILIRFSK